MKIIDIKRLKDIAYHAIWVCVEWDKLPEYDDEYIEELAAKMILEYVNNYPDDYFHIKEGQNSDSKYTAEKYYIAEYLEDCSVYHNCEHWHLE